MGTEGNGKLSGFIYSFCRYTHYRRLYLSMCPTVPVLTVENVHLESLFAAEHI